MIYNALIHTRSDEALDKLSIMERAIQESLYWPDGTRKKCFEPPDKTEDEVHLLVQALVDQYNEDHKLLGVCSLSCPHSELMYYVLLSYSRFKIADVGFMLDCPRFIRYQIYWTLCSHIGNSK
jgi:hypothetical protein